MTEERFEIEAGTRDLIIVSRKGEFQMREHAELTMMGFVLLDSAAALVGLVYVAVRLAIRHSRQNSH